MWLTEYRLDTPEGAEQPIHIGGLGEQQVRSLKAVFAQDGIELVSTVQQRGTDLARRAQLERGMETDFA